MTDAALVLFRLRIEVDQTLRSRSFISRAVRGFLTRVEYLDLVIQLGALLSALEDGGETLVELASRDAAALEDGRWRESRRPPPSPVAAIFRRVTRGDRPVLSPALLAHIGVAVIGTSWTGEAAGRLSGKWPVSLLRELSRRGPMSSSLLQSELISSSRAIAGLIHAYSEMARGALLGLATHLDSAWPAPVAVAEVRFGTKEN